MYRETCIEKEDASTTTSNTRDQCVEAYPE